LWAIAGPGLIVERAAGAFEHRPFRRPVRPQNAAPVRVSDDQGMPLIEPVDAAAAPTGD
jgi:hypothetical protein